MNKPSDVDLDLERLLAASRQTDMGHPAPTTMPPGFAKRVLTLWRVAATGLNQAGLQAASLALMLRRALVCSAVLTLASVLTSALWHVPSDDEGLDLARYELQGELLP